VWGTGDGAVCVGVRVGAGRQGADEGADCAAFVGGGDFELRRECVGIRGRGGVGVMWRWQCGRALWAAL